MQVFRGWLHTRVSENQAAGVDGNQSYSSLDSTTLPHALVRVRKQESVRLRVEPLFC